jgi:putative FmdB family regulatory protein
MTTGLNGGAYIEKRSRVCYEKFSMPLYEYECAKGHRFEAIQKVTDKPLRRCDACGGTAKRAISQPTLLHNRGVHVFDRVTKDDALRARPSSLKSFKKDKF